MVNEALDQIIKRTLSLSPENIRQSKGEISPFEKTREVYRYEKVLDSKSLTTCDPRRRLGHYFGERTPGVDEFIKEHLYHESANLKNAFKHQVMILY